MDWACMVSLCLGSLFAAGSCRPPESPIHGFNQKSTGQATDKVDTCLYERCDLGKPDMLNVHMVAHAHNDLGYRKTADQYYWGAYDFVIQPGAVQYILETVTEALQQNPDRRFIWVETGFLVRWWNQKNNVTKELFKQMVNDGRMELSMGGWVSNDEGGAHYVGMIDQMGFGLKFLRETFGDTCGVPKVATQFDQFGQTREQSSLFAMMGFDGLFFGRISYQDKETRMKDKSLEMMWYASQNLDDQASLFTGILYNKYEAPWDLEPLEPVMDDPRLEEYNVPKRVQQLVDLANDWTRYYNTNHIMVMMGADFEYMNAYRNFINLDKIIKYVNQAQQNGTNINAIMSTPTCYMYALNQANITWKPKYDDFMPLESDPQAIWAGYFTSRSALKRYERIATSFLQACRQVNVMAHTDMYDKIYKLAEEVATMQHHDAITGTCRQLVAYNYALRIYKGMEACQQVVDAGYKVMLPWNDSITATPPTWQFCNMLNVSYCPLSENTQQFSVLVYNQLGHVTTHWMRVPVTGSAYDVLDGNLASVPNQFLRYCPKCDFWKTQDGCHQGAPAMPISNLSKIWSKVIPLTVETINIPDNDGSVATGELVFQVTLPPVGYRIYFIQQSADQVQKSGVRTGTNDDVMKTDEKATKKQKADVVLENEYLSVTFDETTGLLKSLTNKEKAITIAADQTFRYYISHDGGDGSPQSSVYQFHPVGNTTTQIGNGAVTYNVIQGSEVQEFQQVFNSWVSQVYRLYAGSRHLEAEFTIGPIDVADTLGKEIVSIYTTDLETNEYYYTDSNGRESMQRRRFFQPTWDLNVTSPVATNYYPVSNRIYIKDEARDAQLTVITDRSHGGASLKDGQMEIMVQRRLTDDNTGVDEIFDEPGLTGDGIVVRGKMRILLDTIGGSAKHHRELAQAVFAEPTITFAEQTYPPAEFVNYFRTQYSGLTSALPDNVYLLTMETYYDNQVLIRLEHFYEKAEDSTLSQNTTVTLKGLFSDFAITSLEELTLGANQPLATARRLQWNVAGVGRTGADMSSFVVPVDPVTLEVVLKPMQIRTFMLDVVYNTM